MKIFPHFRHDAYAWPGGYPIYYVAIGQFGRFRKTESVLCAECLDKACCSKELPDGSDYKGHVSDIHHEGASITCEGCDEEIESAYGDPDE